MSIAQIIGLVLIIFCGAALWGSAMDYKKWSGRRRDEVIVSWICVVGLTLWAAIGLLMVLGVL